MYIFLKRRKEKKSERKKKRKEKTVTSIKLNNDQRAIPV